MGRRHPSSTATFVNSVINSLRVLFGALCSLVYHVTLPFTQHIFSRCGFTSCSSIYRKPQCYSTKPSFITIPISPYIPYAGYL